MVHLLAPNHGKKFKSFMHVYLPDWQQRERDLQQLNNRENIVVLIRRYMQSSHLAGKHARKEG